MNKMEWGRTSEIQNENKWLASDKRKEYRNNIRKEKKKIYTGQSSYVSSLLFYPRWIPNFFHPTSVAYLNL